MRNASDEGLDAHLTPAEALVLLQLPRTDARLCVKLALRWLVAHGWLEARRETKPGTWLFRLRPRLAVAPPVKGVADPPRDLAQILRCVAEARTDFVEDVVPVLRWTFGNHYANFLRDFVIPSLVGRGLLVGTADNGVMQVAPLQSRVYTRTPQGEVLASALRSAVEAARGIQGLDDGAEIARRAEFLGSLILIVTELRPEWSLIGEAQKAQRREPNPNARTFRIDRLNPSVLDAIDQILDDE